MKGEAGHQEDGFRLHNKLTSLDCLRTIISNLHQWQCAEELQTLRYGYRCCCLGLANCEWHSRPYCRRTVDTVSWEIRKNNQRERESKIEVLVCGLCCLTQIRFGAILRGSFGHECGYNRILPSKGVLEG